MVCYVARDLSRDEIKRLIIDYSETIPRNQPIYPSDVAVFYKLDADIVEELMEELLEEGYFR